MDGLVEKESRWYPYLYWGLLLGYYFLSFAIVMECGYVSDDCWNRLFVGDTYIHSNTLMDITMGELQSWKNMGRAFVFSGYVYYFLTYVPLKLYRALTILAMFFSGVLFAKVLDRLTKSRIAGELLLFSFPVIVSLQADYFNGIYGFHMLLPLCVLEFALSLYGYCRYLDTKKAGFQVLSVGMLFIALGTYEVPYALCIMFVVLFFAECPVKEWKTSFWEKFKTILPQFLTGLFWLGVNIYVKINATEAYNGITINLNPKMVLITFLKQCVGSNSLGMTAAQLDDPLGFWEFITTGFRIRYFFIFVLLLFFYLLIEKQKCGEEEHLPACAFLGLGMVVVPSLLIAVSSRYQSELVWGYGHIPAYASAWGSAFLFVAVYLFFYALVKNSVFWRRTFHAAVIFVLGVVMIINQERAQIGVDRQNEAYQIPIDYLEDAIEAGMFEDTKEEIPIVDITAAGYHPAEPSNLYAAYLKRRAEAYWGTSLYLLENGEVKRTEAGIKTQNSCVVYDAVIGKYAVLADCVENHFGLRKIGNGSERYQIDVLADETESGFELKMLGNISKSYQVDRMKLYITDGSKNVEIENIRGDIVKMNLEESEKRNTEGEGTLYELTFEEPVLLETMVLN